MLKKIFLLLPLTFFLSAVACADPMMDPRLITVQGQGEVKLMPNMSTLQVAVETTAPQANMAVQSNAEKMNQVVAALKKQLGPEDKLSTSRFTLNPTYEYDKDTRKSMLTGYQVTNYITVSTKKLDQMGDLLDMATQAGANRIENLQFTHDNLDSYEQQALSLAVMNAQLTATLLAKAANVSLGQVMSIQPTPTGAAPFSEFSLAKSGLNGGANTPIEPGELSINMTVSVSYAIK